MTSSITRVWLALFVLVIFVGGVGAGVLANNWLAGSRGSRASATTGARGAATGFRGPREGSSSERLIGRLADELDLTGEQRDELETVFEEQRGRMRAFNDDVRARFQGAQEEIRAEIAEILTPEQRERFEQLMAERRRPRGGFRRRPRR